MKSGRTVVSENFFRRFKEVFAPYLSMLDVDSRVLERADIEIPVEQYLALWEAAGKVNPNVGLELGMQSEPDDIGALGHAIHCATTVEKALLTLQQFIIVFAQESNIKLEFDSRTICIEYGVTYPTVISKRQDSEFAIAAILRQLNLITASTIRPTRVDFAHSKPADISAHKLLFQCPIHFNQPANRICLPIETLQLPVAHGNERLYKALEPYLEKERQVRTVTDELLPQITRIVAAEMSSGAPSIDEICDQLNLSRRTLQRRLKEHGIEFSTLIEDVRRELALSYMKESNYSMTEISLLVGYSESASFTRAFRRWTGQSPQQYRAAHLAVQAITPPAQVQDMINRASGVAVQDVAAYQAIAAADAMRDAARNPGGAAGEGVGAGIGIAMGLGMAQQMLGGGSLSPTGAQAGAAAVQNRLSAGEIKQRLAQLKELLDEGLIDEADFAEKKKALIAMI